MVNAKTETGWKRAQEDIRIMRNELGPLWIKFVAKNNAGRGGVINQIPSGTALVELLDKWLRLVYAVEKRRKENIKDKKTLLEEPEVLGGSSSKVCCYAN